MTAHQEKSQTVKKISLETNTEITHVSTACEGGGGWGGPLGLCAGVREWLMIGKLLLVSLIPPEFVDHTYGEILVTLDGSA